MLKILILKAETVSYNKEGKRYGDLSKTFKTCFVEILHDRAVLPDLNSISFERYDQLDSVICLFDEMITGLDEIVNLNSKELVKQNKFKLSEWINEQKKMPRTRISSPVTEKMEETIDKDRSDNSEGPGVTVGEKKDNKKESDKPLFKNAKSRQLYRIAQEVETLESVTEVLRDELKEKTEELSKVKNAYDACNSKCIKLADENKEKDLIIEEKTKEIFDLNFKIREMSDKITRQADAMGTIKEVHGRETEETLNRIASVLKKYYDDYMSSVDMEMSLDLGENMRDMVEDIFRKLEKNGVNIKGR